jgi:hypothetical protein
MSRLLKTSVAGAGEARRRFDACRADGAQYRIARLIIRAITPLSIAVLPGKVFHFET